MDSFINTISEALGNAEAGRRAKADPALKLIYDEIIEEPFVLWDNTKLSDLGKCCMLMVQYDLVGDEEMEIAMAHFAFAYLTRAYEIAFDEDNPEKIQNLKAILKSRIMLFDMLPDFLRHTISYFYLRNPFKASDEERQKSLQLADFIIRKMVAYDLMGYDAIEKDFGGDKYLLGVSNSAADVNEFTANEIEEVKFIHEKLFELVTAKMEDFDFSY